MNEHTTEQTTETHDDWGDEPRRSADGLQAEDRLSALYPNEQEAAESEPEPEPEQAAPKSEQEQPQPGSDDDEAIFSKEDLQLAAIVEPEYAALQRDIAQFAQLKALGPERLANGDKAKAEAIRAQLSEAEDELRKRYETLQAAGKQLAGKVQQRQLKKLERKLEAERQKLAERVPDLDKKALRTYLETRGFTKQEISMAADARLIEMAEKARRYDELMAGKTRKRAIPKIPRKQKQEPERELSRIEQKQRSLDALYPTTRKANVTRRRVDDDRLSILYGTGR